MTNGILKALAAVAIAALVGATPGPRPAEFVWTNAWGASASGGRLTKTGAVGWDAGAISTKGIASGDGYVELVVSETATQRLFGLSHGDDGVGPADVDFAFLLRGDALEVQEQGQRRGAFGKIASGDHLRVAVEGGAIQFSRNGTVLFTSAVAPTYPLLVDASLYTPEATLADVILAGELVPVAVGTPVFSPSTGHLETAQGVLVAVTEPDAVVHITTDGSEPTEEDRVVARGESVLVEQGLTLKARAWKPGLIASGIAVATYTFGPTSTEDVTWIDVIGASASGNSLVKTAGVGGWNAGARSAQELASLDGYVELVASETATRRLFGLSADGTSTDPSAVEFGLLLASGRLSVQEKGKLRANAGAFAEGDRLRIALEGSVVKYRKNGTLLYTSTVSPALPLVVSAALYSVDATLTDVTLAGKLIEVPQAATDAADDESSPTTTDAAPLAAEAPASAAVAASPSEQKTLKAAAPAGQQMALLTLPQVSLAGGTYFTLVAKPDGTVWAWGYNGYKQLGDGTQTNRNLPVQAGVGVLPSVTTVAAGQNHSLALTESGAVWAWGSNSNGQLGDSTSGSRGPSQAVPGLSDVVAIAAGYTHSLAVKSDGSVWTWGANALGQLGDGTTTNRNTPAQVGAGILQDVVAVAAGSGHSLALQRDGAVYAWGDNTYGQLGTGTTTASLVPVQVLDISGLVSIAAGEYHSLAILTGDSLVAWGKNDYGQIGDGATYADKRTTPVSVLSNVQAMSAGHQHTMALRTDGTVWTWGSQWGSSSAGDYQPVLVSGLSDVVAIAAGFMHRLALTSDLTLSTWGESLYGALGDGTNSINRATPNPVSAPGLLWKVGTLTFSPGPNTYTTSQTVTISTATPSVSIYYTNDGTTPTSSSTPYAGGIAVGANATLKAIAAKSGYGNSNVTTGAYTFRPSTPAYSPTGGTYATAQNVSLSTTTTGATIRYTFDSSTPSLSWTLYTAPIPVATTTTIRSAAWKDGWDVSNVGSYTYTINYGPVATPTITPSGGAFTGPTQATITGPTGSALYYTTNGAEPTAYAPSIPYTGPFTVGSTQTVKAKAFPSAPEWGASATASASFTITVPTPTLSIASGTYAAGQTVTATCSDPAATIRYTLNGIDPVSTDTPLAPGAILTLATNMTLKTRGFKANCTDSGVQSATYTVTGSVPTPGVLGAGDAHSLARLSDNTLWAWGANSYGQLGDNTTTARAIPTSITITTPPVTTLGGGQYHSVARKSDGTDAGSTVWAWGINSSGQVGDGTTTTRKTPTQATQDINGAAFTGIASVAAGWQHNLAVKSSSSGSTVWAWGNNTSGQLGDGTTTTKRLKPTQALRDVDGLGITAVAVAGGMYHSLAAGTDTKVYAWGLNTYGQLGDGTTTSRNRGVVVKKDSDSSDLTGIVAVAGGTNHSLALGSNGTVWAWGQAGYGQLGNGLTTNKNKAVQVLGLTGVIAIAAGDSHSLALRNDGTVYGWGLNTSGQLGNGTNVNSPVPIPVLGLAGIRAIAAGTGHGLAMDASGAIWAWGMNASSQLGDGTTAVAFTPIQVRTSSSQWWVATPLLSPVGGSFTTAQTVTITCATSGATIRYTTDGSEPTTSSTRTPRRSLSARHRRLR